MNLALVKERTGGEVPVRDQDEQYEERAVMLIVHGGYARSLALQAIEAAKEGQFESAAQLQIEATEELNKANRFQKEIISDNLEATQEGHGISLMDIHAQDHYMNALTIIDLAGNFIDLFKLKGGR